MKKMKKTKRKSKRGIRLIVILAFVAMLLLSGCTRGGMYVVLMGKVDVQDEEISGSYQYFNGNFFRTLELDEGNTINIDFSHITQKGSISIKVFDKDGEEILSISESEENIQLPINEEGEYTIKAVGSKHKGKFEVDWTIKEDE